MPMLQAAQLLSRSPITPDVRLYGAARSGPHHHEKNQRAESFSSAMKDAASRDDAAPSLADSPRNDRSPSRSENDKRSEYSDKSVDRGRDSKTSKDGVSSDAHENPNQGPKPDASADDAPLTPNGPANRTDAGVNQRSQTESIQVGQVVADVAIRPSTSSDGLPPAISTTNGSLPDTLPPVDIADRTSAQGATTAKQQAKPTPQTRAHVNVGASITPTPTGQSNSTNPQEKSANATQPLTPHAAVSSQPTNLTPSESVQPMNGREVTRTASINSGVVSVGDSVVANHHAPTADSQRQAGSPAPKTRTSQAIGGSPLRSEALSGLGDATESEPPEFSIARQATANASEKHTAQDQSSGRTSPALERAFRVEAAIRLENAGLSAIAVDSPSSAHATHGSGIINPSPVHATLSSGLTADNSTQQLPSFSARLDENPLATQVVRGLGTMLSHRGGVMNMRLDPPELGELRVQMTVQRGLVSATFMAETPQARALLDHHLPTLRAALESQGMTVDRLTVSAQPGSTHTPTRDDQSMTSNHRHQHHDAAGGESRGRRDDQPSETPRRYPMEEFEGMLGEMSQAV